MSEGKGGERAEGGRRCWIYGIKFPVNKIVSDKSCFFLCILLAG